MAQVPVRQPRFLGEKVPYKEQSVQETIQSNLPGYTVVSSNGNYLATATPVQYTAERRGAKRTYATYIPEELLISSEGKVLKETKRGIFKADVFYEGSGGNKKYVGQRQEVYESEVTDYEAQTQFTFGKRDLSSGRETIRQTSSTVGGVVREKRIIDQDSKEYEQSKAQHELFSTFVGQGRNYAESRILSRMTEEQRRAKFKAEAQEQSNKFSVQGNMLTVQHQKQREFEAEYKASATKYASDIFSKQEQQRQQTPFLQRPTTVTTASPVNQNYASPTTRTDMATPLSLPKSLFPQEEKVGGTLSSRTAEYNKDFMVVDAEKYAQQQQLQNDNIVQRVLDKYRFAYAEQTKGLDFHPILSDVAVPFSVGAVNIVAGTVAHPVQAVKGLFHPVEMAKNVQSELSMMTATKGPVYSLSYLGGTIAGAEVLGRGVKKVGEVSKDTYVKTGSKVREAKTVFEPKSVTGEKPFFTVRSTAESLEAFNKGGKSVDVAVAENIVKNPEMYAKPQVKGTVLMNNPVLSDIRTALGPDVVYTGGVARRVVTGEGRIRDIDIVVKTAEQGKADAYAVAKRYPDKYEVIQHEKYPEIYRLRDKKTNKPVADFDPVALAEEGLINPKSIKKVGDYKVVSAETMLQSKATQIIKGKTNPKYPLKQAENIQQLSPETPILKDQVIVTHISPAKIKGLQIEGKLVEKYGLEDTGLYVAPKGKGAVLFTGLEMESVTYSLNPFKNLFGIPSATEISIKGVKTLPKDVVMKPGFEHIAEFQKSQVGKGYAYITKRSQIGTGDVPRQQFFLKKPTIMTGKKVEPGWRWEAGTSEGEAVIGEAETLAYTPKTWLGKIKGFDEYTVIKGRAVAVRQAELLTSNQPVAPSSVVVKGQTVVKGSKALDDLSSGQSTVTPLSSYKSVPFGSLKSSEVPTSSKGVFSQVDLGGVRSSIVSRPESSFSGLSSLSPSQSVTTSYKSSGPSQFSPVSSPVSPVSRGSSLTTSSSGVLLSGRSFESSSGDSSGGSSGGVSSGGGSSGIPIEPIREYPKTYLSPRTEKKERKEQFKVEVRKKGVFKTIAITETPEEAFRIGKFNVEQTASASLRVSPVGSSSKVTGVGKGILPFSKFRESKKEPDVFIQRRQFRIGTPGEKKEITFKGLMVQKNKKVFGRLR